MRRGPFRTLPFGFAGIAPFRTGEPSGQGGSGRERLGRLVTPDPACGRGWGGLGQPP